MDNWTAPKYNFMKHTTVLGGGQFTHSIPLPKREANVQNQPGLFVFDKFTLPVRPQVLVTNLAACKPAF